MKKNPLSLLLLLLSVLTLASCKKTETDYNVGPKLQIVFDNDIDKVTADYKVGSTLSLRVAAAGATSVSIVTTYTSGTTRTVNLGNIQVVDGVATVSVQANSLRATGDGLPVGAGSSPVSSRAANTYTLIVDATGNGTTERRFFSAVLVQ